MKGHGLMQAIARVNRVYKDKQGGLIVDYLGVAQELKTALSIYTQSGGKGKPAFDQSEAIAVMVEKFEVVSQMFYGFDYKKFFEVEVREKMQIICGAMEHIFALADGKKRFLREVTALTKAFKLSVPSDESENLRDEIGLFQAIKASIIKNTEQTAGKKTADELDAEIKQIVSKAVISEGVVDIFKNAGLNKPDISVLSDAFLAEVKEMKHKNLALEALKKLLADEIKTRFGKNKIKDRKFSEMLQETIKKYQNRSIDAAQVILELIEIAKQLREEKQKGKELGLSPEEEAFYDALSNNDSAIKILGNEVLKKIAVELTDLVRKNAKIDWTVRSSVQAKLRVMIKRLLRKYGYPPDKTKMATDLVLGQAKLFAEEWAEEKELDSKNEIYTINVPQRIAADDVGINEYNK
jgi:type I restriction enzyme R subunit